MPTLLSEAFAEQVVKFQERLGSLWLNLYQEEINEDNNNTFLTKKLLRFFIRSVTFLTTFMGGM